MVAVPFQGYAAAAMVFCGPGHAGASAEMSAELPAARDVVQHPHLDGHADQHHEIEQDAKQPVNDSTATGASAEPDAMHKCGICGACHATALIGTLELSVFCDLPRADLAEPAITMVTLAPRVLDKPPRA